MHVCAWCMRRSLICVTYLLYSRVLVNRTVSNFTKLMDKLKNTDAPQTLPSLKSSLVGGQGRSNVRKVHAHIHTHTHMNWCTETDRETDHTTSTVACARSLSTCRRELSWGHRHEWCSSQCLHTAAILPFQSTRPLRIGSIPKKKNTCTRWQIRV